jgi:hypothetical protein
MALIRTTMLTLLAVAGAGVAAPPAERTFTLREGKIMVESETGRPLFLTAHDSDTFAHAGNPTRRVLADDPVHRRIHVGVAKGEPLWVRCAFVVPSPGVCEAPAPAPASSPSPAAPPGERKGFTLVRPTTSAVRPAPATAARPTASRAPGRVGTSLSALPECPGDPRCP